MDKPASPPSLPREIKHELKIKEYEHLTQEANLIMTECAQRERFAVTIIAVVASWIFTHKTENGYPEWVHPVSFVPLISTFLFAFSIRMFLNRMMTIRDYLKVHIFEGDMCWDKFVSDKIQQKKSAVVFYIWMYWLIMVVICIGLILIVR